MNRVLRTAALSMAALGTIWVLQGVGVLPGSFMTGQMDWAWYGALLLLLGLILYVVARPR